MATESGDRIRIVVGIILSEDRGQVLLAKRPEHVHLGGLWEFPGGKQSPSESADKALARELREEIGIEVNSNRRLRFIEYDYPDRRLTIDARIIETWSGSIHAIEKQELAWIPLKELLKVDFPSANYLIIRALLLPDIYFITPNLENYDSGFLGKIEEILKSGIKLLRFRSTNLEMKNRGYYANKVLELCRQYDCKFIYDGSPEEVVNMGADGIHFPASRLMETGERPLSDDYCVAVSCHNDEEIEKANAINADLGILAPVNMTKSHPDSTPLGWESFARLCEIAHMPVYALGGMRIQDLETAKKYHGYGIAMISGLWEESKA